MSVMNSVRLKISSLKLWVAHRYQIRAIHFLLNNPFSGLFLDPGLGKTSITLKTIKILKDNDKLKGVLIVAPIRVNKLVWPLEIAKWINFKNISFTILHGKNKEQNLKLNKDIYLINPEGLPWLYDTLYDMVKSKSKLPFDVLWIDESSKFKSPTAKTRFLLIKDLLPLFKRRHIMTGTPAPKSLLDIWSQIYILDQGESLSPNFYRFRKKYFYTEDWNKYKWILKEGAKEEIENKIHHLVLEMSADDYLDLPEFIENDIYVELPDSARKQYDKFEKEMLLELDNTKVSADQAAQISMKCHQITNGRVYEDIPEGLSEEEIKEFRKTRKAIKIHKAKIDALLDLIEELNGKPLMVAYRFKHDLDALREALGKDIPCIGSGTPDNTLEAIEAAWNASEIPVLLTQPSTMGHGLNMQHGGQDACWFSLTWDLEEYIQWNKRIHRQGSTADKIRIHRLIAKDTVDEILSASLKHKEEQQKSFREALKNYISSKLS